MSKNVYMNLAVKDLPQSKAFFEKLGFGFNPQFTDENAACLILGENIFAMLLTREYFKTFSPGAVGDATTSSQILVALDLPTRAGVDEMVNKAVAAGGKTFRPSQDHGFMYQHAFQDLDGYVWEWIWMNPDVPFPTQG